MSKLLTRCLREERATELPEYALLMGLVLVGSIALLVAIGVRVLDRWQQVINRF